MGASSKRMGADAFSDQRALISGLVGEGRALTVFDVGANVGETVARYLQLFPAARVFAFEAAPDTFGALAQRFDGEDRVSAVNQALTNTRGPLTFHANRDPGTSSLLARPSSGRRYYNREGVLREKITVDGTTLDAFCTEQGVSEIDLLKMDTQGSELMILEGAEELLSAQAIKLIYSEVQFTELYEGAPLFHTLWSHLLRYGYTLFGIYDQVIARNGQLRFADAIFLHPALRREVLDRFGPEPY